MTISTDALNPTDWTTYYELWLSVLKDAEGYEDPPSANGNYLDPIGIPTVGYGYALVTLNTQGVWVVRDDWEVELAAFCNRARYSYGLQMVRRIGV